MTANQRNYRSVHIWYRPDYLKEKRIGMGVILYENIPGSAVLHKRCPAWQEAVLASDAEADILLLNQMLDSIEDAIRSDREFVEKAREWNSFVEVEESTLFSAEPPALLLDALIKSSVFHRACL
jgi:hypothetical protein